MHYLKQGNDNGVFSFKLHDEWEESIVALFSLSIQNEEFGCKLNFDFVKEFCNKYEEDVVSTWQILNKILRKVRE